jgi:hypothetical protein
VKDLETRRSKVGKKVGLTGAEDSGKTHMLNQMLHRNYGEGYSIHTRGVCVKYPQGDDEFVYIDTEGKFKPGSDEHTTEVEELIDTFLVSQCDIIIFMASTLTCYEKKSIDSLTTRASGSERSGCLIIVHNFKNLFKVEDV